MQQRALLIRGLLKHEGKARLLAKDVPWLQKLLRDVQIAQETHRLAEIGRRLEEQQKSILTKNNALADRVAELEREKHIRERNRDRRRGRRELGIILPSDPAAIRQHYAQNKPSPFAQTAPTIAPNSGQIDPTNWTRSGQKDPTIGPRIGQDRDTIGPRSGQESDKVTPTDGQDWRRYISVPIRPGSFAPAAAGTPAPAGDKSAALLARIKKAHYTVDERRGLVLYGGDSWITPEQWLAKMPEILD